MEVLKGRQSEEAKKLEKRKKAIEVELSEIEPLVRVSLFGIVTVLLVYISVVHHVCFLCLCRNVYVSMGVGRAWHAFAWNHQNYSGNLNFYCVKVQCSDQMPTILVILAV